MLNGYLIRRATNLYLEVQPPGKALWEAGLYPSGGFAPKVYGSEIPPIEAIRRRVILPFG